MVAGKFAYLGHTYGRRCSQQRLGSCRPCAITWPIDAKNRRRRVLSNSDAHSQALKRSHPRVSRESLPSAHDVEDCTHREACRRSFEITLRVVSCQKTSRNLGGQSPRTLEFKFCRDCFALGAASVSMHDDEQERCPSSAEQIRCGATGPSFNRSIPGSSAESRSRTGPVGSSPAHASHHFREAA